MEKMTEFEEGASAFTGSESEDESAPVADAEYAADSADLGVTDPSSAETLEQEEALAYDDNAEGYTWDGSSILEVSPTFQKNGTGNGTSIFQPKAGSGLFHRYVFFTPAIIFCTFLSPSPCFLSSADPLLPSPFSAHSVPRDAPRPRTHFDPRHVVPPEHRDGARSRDQDDGYGGVGCEQGVAGECRRRRRVE